jgi:HPt (histidine-containing phosphotransfer) domain-containing protein
MTNAVDESVLLSRLDGDEELLVELIDAFLAESEGLLDRVADAVDRRDAARLERAAHSVKGTVSLFGHREATEAAQTLESMGRAGELRDAPAAAGRVREQVRELGKQLSGVRDRLVLDSARRR